jgi:hypothetical protein
MLLRYLITRTARRQGFLDPVELVARLRSFAQPSEVGEPVELLRAGAVFHARGLINSKVIQYNLDWVWPYWVERQYDPHDASFVPRAFSVSHINMTHRNWTAIGYPDCEEYPLVDPRGLLTPCFDGWSLDGWIITGDGSSLLPSRALTSAQWQDLSDGLSITTHSRQGTLELCSKASVILEDGAPVCMLELTATTQGPGWLVLALRPQNTEGVSFIDKVELSGDRSTWTIEDSQTITFSAPAARHCVSDYEKGDVSLHLLKADTLSNTEMQHEGTCDVGLITAAALFPIPPDGKATLTARIPLPGKQPPLQPDAWQMLRALTCRLQCPDTRFQELYDAAVTSLILHSPNDVYPGPSTYKRFWFRDAAFIIHALLCVGLEDRAARALERFPERQTALGYFRSQEGEWDSNGEVLWILQRYQEITGKTLGGDWPGAITRGARWIMRKRLGSEPDAPHAGLLPAGFSAEHLGPNDYYYWDDFWGIAGLDAAASLLRERQPAAAAEFAAGAADFRQAVDKSLQTSALRLERPGMPASPYRRLDSGAIGSLAAGYPLQLHAPDDPRLLDCAGFLLDNCFVHGAFFQDMIHSGLNAYLTLHVAQILLRAGDARHLQLMDAVAGLATATGQWPEAIHPATKGGCMGDGHHVWAAAEWVLMIRNCFVREEGERLILGAGIPARWLQGRDKTADLGTHGFAPVFFGPAPTAFGPLTLTISARSEDQIDIHWLATWHRPPVIEVRVPGYRPVQVDAATTFVILSREESPG